MKPARRIAAALTALVLAGSAARGGGGPEPLPNGSFEDWDDRRPTGWEVVEGARDGESGQQSEIAPDTERVKDGATSLRLSGGAGTTSWNLVRRAVPVAPGERVTLRAWAMSRNVRKEGRQYPNANALVEFVDAKGGRVGVIWTPTCTGTSDWRELRASGFVPEGAVSARAGVFLSQSGTLWFDGVRVERAPGDLASEAGRAAAFDALADHLADTYPFFGHGRKPAAPALFPKWRDRAVAAKDDAAFVQAVRAMLGELDDVHVWIEQGKTVTGTASTPSPKANFDAALRVAALGPHETTDALAPLFAARAGGGDGGRDPAVGQAGPVGYVEIQSFRMDAAAEARLGAAIDGMSDCRGLVIDVRNNSGGDEAVALRLARRFAAAETPYAVSRTRDPSADAVPAPFTGLSAPVVRSIPAAEGGKPDARRVAVLQGPRCMSSCEGFLLMARALPTVRTFGARSRGASGNPKPFTVAPGIVVRASTWRAYPPDGECIEGRGVDPEEEVPWKAGAAADPVLARALAWVRDTP